MNRALRWGAPLGIGVLSLLHPLPAAGDVAGTLTPVLVRWQAVHILQLVAFPLVALAAYRLLPIGATTERSVARIAFSVFAVSAAAYDSLAGLGTGSAVAIAGHDPERMAFVQDYFTHRVVEPTFWIVYVGTAIGWLIGIGAVALGIWRSRSSWGAVALLVPAGALGIDHIPPYGVVAALGLLGATWLLTVRGKQTTLWAGRPRAARG